MGGKENWIDEMAAQKERIQQLEEENDKLKALNKALKVQKDPEQHLIPWDKAKQDLRIQELEEALREARAVLHEILSGQEDSPLVSWDVVGTIDTALSREPADVEEEG